MGTDEVKIKHPTPTRRAVNLDIVTDNESDDYPTLVALNQLLANEKKAITPSTKCPSRSSNAFSEFEVAELEDSRWKAPSKELLKEIFGLYDEEYSYEED